MSRTTLRGCNWDSRVRTCMLFPRGISPPSYRPMVLTIEFFKYLQRSQFLFMLFAAMFRLFDVTELKRALMVSLFYIREWIILYAKALKNYSRSDPVDSHKLCNCSIFDWIRDAGTMCRSTRSICAPLLQQKLLEYLMRCIMQGC